MQGINRIVIYQNRLNITDIVLDTLNRGTPPAAQGTPVAQPAGYRWLRRFRGAEAGWFSSLFTLAQMGIP